MDASYFSIHTHVLCERMVFVLLGIYLELPLWVNFKESSGWFLQHLWLCVLLTFPYW